MTRPQGNGCLLVRVLGPMELDAWLVRALPTPGAVPILDALMIAATTAGLAILAVALPLWLWRRSPRLGRAAVIALGAGLLLSVALQLLSLRPRPAVAAPLLPVPALPSFPSGHAVLVTIALVTVGAHRLRVAATWLPLALVVCLSRVHLGHHHATDVLGGVLVGAGLGLGAIAYARAAPRDPWRHRWLLWPQLGLVLAVSLVAYTGTFARGEVWWLRLPGMDKLLHFLMFGLLALGVHLHTRGKVLCWGRLGVPLAILVPLSGAAAEELVQALSPHRTADPIDLLADGLGMLTFWWIGTRLGSTPRHPAGPKGRRPREATRRRDEALPSSPEMNGPATSPSDATT